MIVQTMKFEGEDYSKIVALRDELKARGEAHQFFGYREAYPNRTRPQIIHMAYPHTDETKHHERTLVGLYLWHAEKKGEISFITPSEKAFQEALQAVRDLIKETTRETKSGIEVICVGGTTG